MKKLLILLIIVIVAVLVWWMLSSNQAAAPTNEGANESASLETELNGLTDADLDAEFKSIDDDAEQL